MDIKLYVNSAFCGYQTQDTIEEYFEEYKRKAEDASEHISGDEVVVYAALSFEAESERILSASFMNTVMDYETYAEMCQSFPDHCRMFFIRNKRR